jgi:hypothetical protein
MVPNPDPIRWQENKRARHILQKLARSMCHPPKIARARFAREKKKEQTQIFCVIELKISLLCMSFIDPVKP